MDEQEFMKRYASHLTKEQAAAVTAVTGAVLLLAVPGSGKTTVLVMRLGCLIYVAKIPPENILTVTYTVAATRDMENRFARIFGPEDAERLEFRTINGICAKIIAIYGRRVGRKPFELLTDERRIAAILSEIYHEVMDDYAAESDLMNVRRLITYIKNRMLSPEELEALNAETDCRISDIFRAYSARLRAEGLMDYDDQMVYALNILRRDAEVLSFFRKKYPYICVDEAQDTSKIQHAIIALLAGENANLFMVGDEDQSIYGFRAAYPDALLSFETDHPGAKVLLMEENFRSDKNIVAMADRFISRNFLRHEKHMVSSREGANQVRKVVLKGRKAQYSYLLKVAADADEETAVLYRDNESALPLIDLLERKGIPYRVRSADLTFFSSRVVRDVSDIIRFAENPADTDLFMRIYYKLSMYLSRENANRAAALAMQLGISPLEAAAANGNLPAATMRSVKAIEKHLKELPADSGEAAIRRIADFMGYRDYLARSGARDSKLFILRQIGEGTKSPGELLRRLDELNAKLREKENDPSVNFILSTIHASKGLEYKNVYMIDVRDGLFPETIPPASARPGKGRRENVSPEWRAFEEERRLFFVGVTRAKDQLAIFSLPGKSVFVDEFFRPAETAEKPVAQAGRRPVSYRAKKAGFDEAGYARFREGIGEGLIVSHRYFGEGVVTEVAGDTVKIRFNESGEEKKLMLTLLYQNDLLRE